MIGSTASRKGAEAERDIPAAITDVGCEREINEDRYAVIDSPLGKVWLVCDGMGGVMGGELAAQLAIDAIRRTIEQRYDDTPTAALQQSIEEANRVIVLRRQNPAFSAMGTTVVAAMLYEDEVTICHAGDSRAYIVRDGNLEQLTIDHTYVQDLVDRGAISEDEAMSHPQAHVLTRCIGAEPHLKLDVKNYWIWPATAGESEDTLVLASDGLYSLVEAEEMAQVIASSTPQQACVELVEMAKSRGGYDNITVGVIPLRGQLRDEAPAGVRKPRRAARKMLVQQSTEPSLSLGQQLIILALLTVIGIVGGGMIAIFAHV